MPYAWLNNAFIDEDQPALSLRDTGLLHAAGVFTTMRSDGGKVFGLAQHLQRLRDSCNALSIPLQYTDDELAAAVAALLDRNDLADARMRLTVTRGAAVEDPAHGLVLRPNVFLTATEMQPYPDEFYQRGMTVILLDEQKLNPYDLQAGHKTLNYFSRLAALRSAALRSAGEALWFNVHNQLQSGSISNVFIVKAGRLFTPPTPIESRDPESGIQNQQSPSAVLPGITRRAVLDLAESAGVEARLDAIDVNQLLDADEVFLTNSIMRIMPVCRIERAVIGDDRPGPVTRTLTAALQSTIESDARTT